MRSIFPPRARSGGGIEDGRVVVGIDGDGGGSGVVGDRPECGLPSGGRGSYPMPPTNHGKSFNYDARPPAGMTSTEAFLVSVSSISVAEIGDRTQLLSLVLSARYRRPLPILAGILCATLANHAAAGLIGNLFGDLVRPRTLQIAVGVSMIGMALWTLKPDTLDEGAVRASAANAFVATLTSFFVAEMGDKTQIATVALAAAGRGRRHHPRNARRQRAGGGLGQGVRRSAATEGDSLRRVAPVPGARRRIPRPRAPSLMRH